MKESRVTQLLRQSRSRHSIVENPELKKISRQWQNQKRKSKQSNDEIKKMLREMRYYEKLNQKLTKEVNRGKRKLSKAQNTHNRHIDDLKKKKELQDMRIKSILQNQELANKIKQDRLKKINACKRQFYFKQNVGRSMRCQSRRLTELRDEESLEQLNKNRSKIEDIIQFELSSKQKSVKRRQSAMKFHLQRYKQDIKKQNEGMRLKERQSVTLKTKLRTLTQNSNRKVHLIQNLNQSINKYSSPYNTPSYFGKYKRAKNSRNQTQKLYQDSTQQESSIFVSQHYYQG